MKRIHKSLWLGGCIAFILLLPGKVCAQTQGGATAQAQVLFQEAKADMDAGKHALACPKLEESNRLDPGMGTQYRLAECYEYTGKLASAWSLYKDVEAAARQAGKKDREEKARERALALEPRLPKIQVTMAPATGAIAGLEVKRNNVVMGPPSWGRAIPVDLGTQRIAVTAPRKKTWVQTIEMAEGETTEVTVDPLEDISAAAVTTSLSTAKAAPAAPDASAGSPADPSRASATSGTRFTAAIVLAATGVVAFAAGIGLGVVAKSSWDDGTRGCERDKAGKPILQTCPSPAETEQSGNSAEAVSHGATAGFAIGGVGLALAGILLLTAQPEKPIARRAGWFIAPALSHEHAGMTIVGTF